MGRHLPLLRLEDVTILSPCPASWEKMDGNDRIRFCGECGKSVYNIALMTRDEAAMLMSHVDGPSCVRLFWRPDGMVQTSDCPIGLRERSRQAVRRAAAGAAHVVAFFAGILIGLGGASLLTWKSGATPSLASVLEPKPEQPVLMGKPLLNGQSRGPGVPHP